MLKLFRRIRVKLIGEGNLKKYLLYTTGEIVLIVAGILIALQIDSWNQQRAENQEERRLLTNLRKDLQNDIAQLEINIGSARDRRAQMDTILTILAEPGQHSVDRFLALIYPLFFESHFEVNSGTYDESLASGTIKFVRDDSLRQEIFEYYRDAKLSYSDQHSLKLTYEMILPQFVRTLAPSQDFVAFFAQKPTLLPGLDLASIARDKDFFSVLMLKYGTEEDQIRNWDRFRKMAWRLLKRTEGQLEDHGGEQDDENHER